MEVRLSEKASLLLLQKAHELGVSPEALASSVLEEHCQSEPTGLDYRKLTLGELRELALSGTSEQKRIANVMRTRFIRN